MYSILLDILPRSLVPHRSLTGTNILYYAGLLPKSPYRSLEAPMYIIMLDILPRSLVPHRSLRGTNGCSSLYSIILELKNCIVLKTLFNDFTWGGGCPRTHPQHRNTVYFNRFSFLLSKMVDL